MNPLIELLKMEFDKKKEKNPAFSLRRFSKILGIDPSNLSKILAYKKEISQQTRKKILEKFDLNQAAMAHLNFEIEKPSNFIFVNQTAKEHYFSLYVSENHTQILNELVEKLIKELEPYSIENNNQVNTLRLSIFVGFSPSKKTE